MSEWQPIGTYDKDLADHVLVGSIEHDWVVEAFWYDFHDYVEKRRSSKQVDPWEGAHGWSVYPMEVMRLMDVGFPSPPTHWMPMPNGPS